MKKKTIGAAVAAVLACAFLLAGCSGSDGRPSSSSDQGAAGDERRVVCATFPAYDWTMQVLGDRAGDFEVTYLMGGGVDLHSYQPTVEDMATILDADLFVYVGGESDEWAQDAVRAAGSEGPRALSLLEAVGDAAVEEETVEGMQAEDEEDGAEGEGPEHDEHVWLSLRNAQVLVDAIASELSAVDPEGAEVYAANAEAYNALLAELDGRYSAAVGAGAKEAVVFADRFPFRYLADDYGLSYYAAFAGCSAETEASFETVAFLAGKVGELDVGAVLVIEGSDRRIAETVLATAGGAQRQIVVMDSLQSVTDADIAAGKTYLSAMEANLDALAAALA